MLDAGDCSWRLQLAAGNWQLADFCRVKVAFSEMREV
jgi:hypothetical protein